MVRRYARSRDPTRSHWKMKSSYSYKVHPRNRRVGGRVVSDKSWSKMKRRSAQKIGLTTTGKALARGVPYLGWALLAYDAYDYVKSREISYQITESTPKLPYDLEPRVETPEYQYQDLTGYEDDGPVHWTRTV